MFGDKYVIPQKLIKYLKDLFKPNESLKRKKKIKKRKTKKKNKRQGEKQKSKERREKVGHLGPTASILVFVHERPKFLS